MSWIVPNRGNHGLERLYELGVVVPDGSIVAVNFQVAIEPVPRCSRGKIEILFDPLKDATEIISTARVINIVLQSVCVTHPQLSSPVRVSMKFQSLRGGRTLTAALMTEEPPSVAPRG